MNDNLRDTITQALLDSYDDQLRSLLKTRARELLNSVRASRAPFDARPWADKWADMTLEIMKHERARYAELLARHTEVLALIARSSEFHGGTSVSDLQGIARHALDKAEGH